MARATPADAWKITAADPIFRGVVNKLVWRSEATSARQIVNGQVHGELGFDGLGGGGGG
jgi:hypothetical protein